MGFQDPPLFRAPAPLKARWEDQLSPFGSGQADKESWALGLAWSSSEDRGAVGRGVCGGERPRGTGRTAVGDAVWAAESRGERGNLRSVCTVLRARHLTGLGGSRGGPASPQALCSQQKQGGRCMCEGTNVSSLLGESWTETPPGESSERKLDWQQVCRSGD